MQRKSICVIAGLAVMLGITFTAIADSTDEDAAEYRVAVMTSLRGHMHAASMIVRGLVENDGYLAKHARGMENGISEVHRLFVEGSNVGESAALPVIWEVPEKFAKAIANAEKASVAFTEAAKSNDADDIGGAFRNLGLACRGCHDDFRRSDD